MRKPMDVKAGTLLKQLTTSACVVLVQPRSRIYQTVVKLMYNGSMDYCCFTNRSNLRWMRLAAYLPCETFHNRSFSALNDYVPIDTHQ